MAITKPWKKLWIVFFAFLAVVSKTQLTFIFFIINIIIRDNLHLFGTNLTTQIISSHVGINGSNGTENYTLLDLHNQFRIHYMIIVIQSNNTITRNHYTCLDSNISAMVFRGVCTKKSSLSETPLTIARGLESTMAKARSSFGSLYKYLTQTIKCVLYKFEDNMNTIKKTECNIIHETNLQCYKSFDLRHGRIKCNNRNIISIADATILCQYQKKQD